MSVAMTRLIIVPQASTRDDGSPCVLVTRLEIGADERARYLETLDLTHDEYAYFLATEITAPTVQA